MEYCGPRALPHSEFLKWKNEDQDKALAWMLDQGDRCNSCGSYAEEWMGPDGHPVEPPPMFVHSHSCLGCITLHEHEEMVKTGNSGNIPTGMKIYLGRTPPTRTEEDQQ